MFTCARNRCAESLQPKINIRIIIEMFGAIAFGSRVKHFDSVTPLTIAMLNTHK